MTADAGTAPLPQPSPAPAPPRKSNLLKWLLIGGLGCFFLIILGIGGCIGTLFFALNKAKDTAFYKDALALVQQDPQAQEALGTPIAGGTPTQFHFSTTSGGESGTLVFGVSGPKGEGTVNAAGATVGGKWVFKTLTLTVGGNTIPIKQPAAEDQVR